MNQHFFNQVRLFVSVLPFIAKEKCFALKGGTAINLFIRDMQGYLLSHPRPMAELLAPKMKDISKLYMKKSF